MSEEKETSLSLAIFISLASFLLLLFFILSNFGVNFSNFTKLSSHPGAFFEFVAEAVGGSLALPAIHVGIYSIFKSKRNRNTRRSIFIGWGLFSIILHILNNVIFVK